MALGWRAYPEPDGKPSRYAILSRDGRWSVARIGAFPAERFEVWEKIGDGWARRGDYGTAAQAKARAEDEAGGS